MKEHLHKVHINLWFVLGTLLVVFTWGWWSFQKDLVTPAIEVANVPINIVKKVVGISKPSNNKASMSYEEALVVYKDKRIQLDMDCKAFPRKMTFKEGTSIMIDNRAPVSRTVTVGSTFTVAKYDFKIVNLSSATLPVTWPVNCDKNKQVATILIQK